MNTNNDASVLHIYKDEDSIWHVEEENFDLFEFDMSMSAKDKEAVWQQFLKWLNLMVNDTQVQ